MNPLSSILERLASYDKYFLLTSREVSAITGIPVGTLGGHRYSGLLPFIPGRPVHHRVGDVRVYARMVGNGVAHTLHPSLRIAHEDRRPYNPLSTVEDFTVGKSSDVIAMVVEQTNAMWNTYKAAGTLYKRKGAVAVAKKRRKRKAS